MVKLPIFQSDNKEVSLMQTRWASLIEPAISSPLVDGVIVNAVLATGVNVINHRLGRKPQGWIMTDRNSAATVFRSQPFNPLTLTLTASATVTVSLFVF